MGEEKEDLTFDEFREAVNAGTANYGVNKIRDAIVALKLTPYPLRGARRRSFFARGWAAKVREYLDSPQRP